MTEQMQRYISCISLAFQSIVGYTYDAQSKYKGDTMSLPITPFRITEEERAWLRDFGSGNLSAGLRLAIKKLRSIGIEHPFDQGYSTFQVAQESTAEAQKAPTTVKAAPRSADVKQSGLCHKCKRLGKDPRCPECGTV